MLGGDAKEHAGGTGGLAATLLPIAQCRRADAKRRRKCLLTETQFGANGGDRFGVDVIDAGRGALVSAKVGTGFADALEEILKIGFFHGWNR